MRVTVSRGLDFAYLYDMEQIRLGTCHLCIFFSEVLLLTDHFHMLSSAKPEDIVIISGLSCIFTI
jgi:hypothetical protein